MLVVYDQITKKKSIYYYKWRQLQKIENENILYFIKLCIFNPFKEHDINDYFFNQPFFKVSSILLTQPKYFFDSIRATRYE